SSSSRVLRRGKKNRQTPQLKKVSLRAGGGFGGGGGGLAAGEGGGAPPSRWRGEATPQGATAALQRSRRAPQDAMKRSVQAINSSPWAGERERSTLSSLAAALL